MASETKGPGRTPEGDEALPSEPEESIPGPLPGSEYGRYDLEEDGVLRRGESTEGLPDGVPEEHGGQSIPDDEDEEDSAKTIGSITIEKLPQEQITFYEEMGYVSPIKINGDIVAIGAFLYTTGIICGLDETGYKHRFCYHSPLDAHEALISWIMSGEPEPTGYIKRKPD